MVFRVTDQPRGHHRARAGDSDHRHLALRRRCHRELAEDPGDIATAWGQQHGVLGLCRFLYTVLTGSVTSKVTCGRWALATLDQRWRGLIQRAIDDRPDPWSRVGRPVDPALVDPTHRFADHAMAHAEAHACSAPQMSS